QVGASRPFRKKAQDRSHFPEGTLTSLATERSPVPLEGRPAGVHEGTNDTRAAAASASAWRPLEWRRLYLEATHLHHGLGLIIEVARSACRVARSRALGPGMTERASEGPGKAAKRVFVEILTAASVRKCPLSGKIATLGPSADLSIVSCGRSRPRSSDSDEKQLPGKLSSSSTSRSESSNSDRRGARAVIPTR
ncbi:hypothetical protein THAOC_30015, partial [Thalassiosira oceanica]